MKFLLPLTLVSLAIAGVTLNARDDKDEDEQGGPLGIGGDDGLLGTKLLSDDGLNVVSDGKFLGIGNDDGLLNSGFLATEDDDDDDDDDD